MKLREVMQSPVYTCSPTATLTMAAEDMEAHNVGSLVVTDEDDKIVGIITDRDLALCLARGRAPAAMVGEIMSDHVVSIPVDATIDDAVAAMDGWAVRRLPVADEQGRAVGMVCLDDLYNHLTLETITLAGAVRAQGAPQA
jgi:CBS domain-containing protein